MRPGTAGLAGRTGRGSEVWDGGRRWPMWRMPRCAAWGWVDRVACLVRRLPFGRGCAVHMMMWLFFSSCFACCWFCVLSSSREVLRSYES